MVVGELRRSERGRAVAERATGWWILAILVLLLRVISLLQARERLFFNCYADSLLEYRWALYLIQG